MMDKWLKTGSLKRKSVIPAECVVQEGLDSFERFFAGEQVSRGENNFAF